MMKLTESVILNLSSTVLRLSYVKFNSFVCLCKYIMGKIYWNSMIIVETCLNGYIESSSIVNMNLILSKSIYTCIITCNTSDMNGSVSNDLFWIGFTFPELIVRSQRAYYCRRILKIILFWLETGVKRGLMFYQSVSILESIISGYTSN